MIRILFIAALVALVAAGPSSAGETADATPPDFSLLRIPEVGGGQTAGPAAFQAMPAASGAPSVGRAVLYSLLLPGLGDYYAGRRDRARYFFIAEGAIWSAFTVFRIQGHDGENSYKDFAVQFAGIRTRDHSDDFYAELRQWDSSSEYERDLKNEGRFELWPDVGDASLDAYFESNRVADFEPWEWVSFERRLEYQKLRSSSKEAYRRSMYAIAAAATNRVVSAIFAYHAVRSAGSSEERAEPGYRLDFTPPARYASEYDLSVSLVRTF